MVKVGQKVRFDPFCFVSGSASESIRGNLVTGTVVEVYEPHKWFSVEYGDPKTRTSFKFCDIGERVKIVG
jgi:hypothetical protein